MYSEMKSKYKLTMCRLCLCQNQCFFNIFQLNDWHAYIAAEVISNLLQFQVSETDGYPGVVCSKCLVKLTDFKQFKEFCQKSIVMYDNMFVSKKNLEENKPEVDIVDCGSGLELCKQDPLGETSTDVTIKSEEVIIDSSSYEVSEDPLVDTEVSCGPILLKYEVLPFSRDSRLQEELIDSEVSGNQSTFESAGALMQDSPQVELQLGETITHPKYPHTLENKRPHFTSKGEIVADSCNYSISTNDELIFEKTKNISLSEEVEASSSGTMERLECQRILPGESMDKAFHFQQEKERMRMKQNIGGDGKAGRGTGREKGARERREGLECFHCGIVLKNKLDLIQHMKVHGFVNSYDCPECGKVFRFNSVFKRHLVTHTGSKPHKCEECSKGFTQRSNLKQHMQLHTGSKPYKCVECSKSFCQNSHLKVHMRLHTGCKPYKCAECSKCFAANGTLTRHMRIHIGSKQFKCTECRKSFSEPSYLKAHKRIHTGFKPYKCAECSKHFHQNSSLKRHIRLHTGSKPYKCAECNKSFRQSFHLRSHEITHRF